MANARVTQAPVLVLGQDAGASRASQGAVLVLGQDAGASRAAQACVLVLMRPLPRLGARRPPFGEDQRLGGFAVTAIFEPAGTEFDPYGGRQGGRAGLMTFMELAGDEPAPDDGRPGTLAVLGE